MKAAVSLAAILLALSLFQDRAFVAELVTSDTLLPASLVWDLAHNPEAWGQFQLPRIPSLLPDIALFAAAQALSGSWRIALMVYAASSALALTWLAGLLVNRIAGISATRGASAFLLIVTPLLAWEILGGEAPEAALHSLIFYPVSHGGAFLWALAALLTESPVLLFLLVAAGFLSDKLFLLTALLPLLILADRRRLLAAFAGVAMAYFLDHLLLRQPDLPLDASRFGLNIRLFLESPWNPLGKEAPVTMTIGIFLPILLFLTHKRSRWWWAAAASMAVSAAATALVYYDVPSYRYLSPIFWWPLFFAAARLAAFPVERAAPALAALPLFLWHGPPDWSDPLAACLQKAGLKTGLGEYWYARYLEAASDWSLQLDQITIAGQAYYWGNDPHWYFHDKADPSRPPPYDFILMAGHPERDERFGKDIADRRLAGAAGFDPKQIEGLYGAPDRVITCPTSAGSTRDRGPDLPVWIYGHSLARRLLAASPALWVEGLRRGENLEIGAERLNSKASTLVDGALVAKGDGEAATWGPYLSLPAGRYKIGLSYRLDQPGHWRITANAGKTVLFEGELPAVDGMAEATITADHDLVQLEAVTLPPAGGEIAVRGLYAQRLNL